jgi:hypothetical protein
MFTARDTSVIERDFSKVAASSCAPLALRRDATAALPPGTSGALPEVTTLGAMVLSESVAEITSKLPVSPSASMGTAPINLPFGTLALSFACASASCSGVRPHSTRKCISAPLTPPCASLASVVNLRNRNSGVPSGLFDRCRPGGR